MQLGLLLNKKDCKKQENHENDSLDDIFNDNSHELQGVAKIFS